MGRKIQGETLRLYHTKPIQFFIAADEYNVDDDGLVDKLRKSRAWFSINKEKKPKHVEELHIRDYDVTFDRVKTGLIAQVICNHWSSVTPNSIDHVLQSIGMPIKKASKAAKVAKTKKAKEERKDGSKEERKDDPVANRLVEEFKEFKTAASVGLHTCQENLAENGHAELAGYGNAADQAANQAPANQAPANQTSAEPEQQVAQSIAATDLANGEPAESKQINKEPIEQLADETDDESDSQSASSERYENKQRREESPTREIQLQNPPKRVAHPTLERQKAELDIDHREIMNVDQEEEEKLAEQEELLMKERKILAEMAVRKANREKRKKRAERIKRENRLAKKKLSKINIDLSGSDEESDEDDEQTGWLSGEIISAKNIAIIFAAIFGIKFAGSLVLRAGAQNRNANPQVYQAYAAPAAPY